MSRKYTSHSLLIVFRRDNSLTWRKYVDSALIFPDHTLFLTPEDVEPEPDPNYDPRTRPPSWSERVVSNLEKVIDFTPSSRSFTDVWILAEHGNEGLFQKTLEILTDRIDEKTRMSVVGFAVTGELFRSVTVTFEAVDFSFCHFDLGWCQPATLSEKCKEITFKTCTCVATTVPSAVCAGTWPALRSISIREGNSDSSLDGRTSYEVDSNVEARTSFTIAIVSALWNSRIVRFDLDRCRNIEFVANLPISNELKWAGFPFSATSLSVFEWILKHRKLTYLDLAWKKSTRLPWMELVKLKRLWHLDVSNTHLDDDELQELLEIPNLTLIDAYYTSVSAASWGTVLRSTTLKNIWLSQEAMRGDFPPDLPESTELSRVVALNARVEEFIAFLAPYPNVRVDYA